MKLVFVYGSLCEGLRNHYVLNGSIKLSDDAHTADDNLAMFNMRHGGYPGVCRDDAGQMVKGELYQVTEAILADLDRLEGHPSFYKRELTRIVYEGGTTKWAYIYLLEADQCSGERVADNDWRRYKMQPH